MNLLRLSLGFSLLGAAVARTDLAGCVSSATVNQWHEASMIWYVPGTGEICDFPDCGGGRAPPKTDQPGCPLYSGTASLTASYLSGYGPDGKMAATTLTASTTASSGSSSSEATSTIEASSTHSTTSGSSQITPAPTTSPKVSMTTTTANVSASTSSVATPTGTNQAANVKLGSSGVVAMAFLAIGMLV